MGREATLQPDVIDGAENFIKMKRSAGRSMRHVSGCTSRKDGRASGITHAM
jgi:hypothetical protein